MGRGSSGAGKKAVSGAPKANTPSGISYDQFIRMSDSEKYDVMDRIINDANITVPAYLDDSVTSKVIYALGMNNKPTVVSDDQLDKMAGKDLYRTVYDTRNPPPSGKDILDQIRNGDYTQMSGSGGSAHGRAIYFARNDFGGSASYGNRGNNPVMMRAKYNANANIIKESTLHSQMRNDTAWSNHKVNRSIRRRSYEDEMALYALAHRIDGWHADWGSYQMVVNRGALVVSNTTKSTKTYAKTPTGRIRKSYGKPVLTNAKSWATADDA